MRSASSASLRRAHPRVAECAEILARKERKAADVADRTRPAPHPVLGADGLRGIFDHFETVAPRDRHAGPHVGGLAVQVHRA